VIRIGACALIWAALVSTSAPPPVNDTVILSEALPPKLSEFRLLSGAQGRVPNRGVTPYALKTPLFSDYAEKFRFAYVPGGKPVDAGDHDGLLGFPVGSVLVKSFGYPADMRQPTANIRMIETRLLIHRASGWVALPYVWDADGQDATLKRAGTRVDVSWIHNDGTARAINYSVPNVNQCRDCHERAGAITPIGPKTRNLSAAYLITVGIPARRPLPAWNDAKSGSLNDRARAYLDVNCAHCHNRAGAASNSGLYLDYDEPAGITTGIGKEPVAAGRGSGGFDHDIEPGHPETSIMTYRLASTDPGIAMPELGRGTAHAEGLALLSEWIKAMPAK
jgi:uncharacterized repeat protein (TIGR03806 family)